MFYPACGSPRRTFGSLVLALVINLSARVGSQYYDPNYQVFYQPYYYYPQQQQALPAPVPNVPEISPVSVNTPLTIPPQQFHPYTVPQSIFVVDSATIATPTRKPGRSGRHNGTVTKMHDNNAQLEFDLPLPPSPELSSLSNTNEDQIRSQKPFQVRKPHAIFAVQQQVGLQSPLKSIRLKTING